MSNEKETIRQNFTPPLRETNLIEPASPNSPFQCRLGCQFDIDITIGVPTDGPLSGLLLNNEATDLHAFTLKSIAT